MASSSSPHRRNEEHDAFSGIEPQGKRRKVEESSRLFDVFINHRGPDVKQTVALQLYKSLTELGIHAFLDSEEKELGDSFPSTIENAIHSASAHIAIFSNGYADSPWCLAELILMLQSKAKIFPVFYGVKPSALRYVEKGDYAQAFAKYEEKERYMEKLEEWKQALQSVSFTAGHEISGSNFNVSDCQNIVSAVQKEVQRTKSLIVAKYPVGLHKLVEDFEKVCLDNLVEDFEKVCQTNEGGKGKAQIVGIFGMGGVGKTTLAKELFNRKQSQYSRACFLFDVREAYANSKFPSLQLKLLQDLFQRDRLNFQCTEEGTSEIGDCIGRSNQLSFLIVVDDIDHLQQLDALLIMQMLKKSVDSMVIVTTRDVGVLVNTGITAAYNLKGMDRDHARELFCWHAFGQPHPDNDYQDLVNSFLNVCGGLPLSLQVLGSHVRGTDQDYWSGQLNKVSKTLPRDILQRLKISFDALDYEEQQIFMDLACFFVDELKSISMKVWEASGWNAQHALKTLKNKCLVQESTEVGRWVRVGEDRSALRMHDHLRDMGREMANGVSRPHRLWRPRDLQYLESKGSQNILAQTKGRCFHSILDKRTGYRITYFVGKSDFSTERATILLWLQVEYQGFQNIGRLQPSIPLWIPLQNLRYLIISNLLLKTLWQSHVQAPTQLKKLQIHNTYMEEISDLSGMSNSLEKILIDGCNHLKTVSGLSNLKKLVELNISRCSDLQELSVVHLICLEKLVLHNCYGLKTVSGISDLRKLVELNICGCPVNEQLRLAGLNSLKCITVDLKLKYFELDDCKNLKTISGNLNLEELASINIRDCPKLEVLPSLKGPSNLETVTIDGCGKLNSLLLSGCGELNCLQLFKCQNLKQVSISDCWELEELPCFACRSCLEEIIIVRCGKLQKITLPTTLVELRIEDCRQLKTVAMICDHSESLEPQELSSVAGLSCLKLQTIQGIDELCPLESIKLFDCPELEELPCFARQTCLEEITIVRCGKLQNITLPTTLMALTIEDCRELKTVAMVCDHSECLELHELSSVAQLSCLKQITIEGCYELQTIPGIDELPVLESLRLFDCPRLEELPCFARQTCLEEIIIVRCGKLQNITLPTTLMALTIENCRELKTVATICDHSECLELEELSSVARLSCLKQIIIVGCYELQTIQGIDELGALESLWLSDCPELEELPCFACQTCFEEITIVRCGKLQNITLPTTLMQLRIEDCRELEIVATICDHSECLELQELSSVARLSCLKQITIVGCYKLQTIQGIDELPVLESLRLSGCPRLEELPCFARQTCLQEITIVRCGKLQNITLPTTLTQLRIKGCGVLKTVARICDHSECLELEELSSVGRLSCLKQITIEDCYELQAIQGIDELPVLESLRLSDCPRLEELPCFACQTCLEEITIVRCRKLQNITLSTTLMQLRIEDCRELEIVVTICDHSECLELQELSSVAQLSCLKQITIVDCYKLQTIQGIDKLPVLESLQLSGCPRLEELPCFARQTCLEKITIVRCWNLQNITLPTTLTQLKIEGCAELETVAMICDHSECLELEELSSVARLSCLKQLTIVGCYKLQTIQGIDELPVLESLRLSDCPRLEELPCFARQTYLEKITIVRCGKLQNITLPTTLVELKIEDCRELKTVVMISDHSECLEPQELSTVAGLSCLKQITIEYCDKLQTIRGIDELHALKSIQLLYCNNAAIQNCITMLKSVPSELLAVMGRAADGALSTLNSHLFSDASAVIDEIDSWTSDKEIMWGWSAIIFCAVVVVHDQTSLQMIHRCLLMGGLFWPWNWNTESHTDTLNPSRGSNVWQGEWIITIVTTDQDKIRSYLEDDSEEQLVSRGIMKKRYKVGVKKGEEWKTQHILHRIINKLYHE